MIQFKPEICFITDGGTQFGLGHIQQSTSFARELSSQANIRFMTKSDETVVAKIRDNGFATTFHATDADILLHLEAQKPDVIIFDKLDVAEELARDIKKRLSAKLIIFTNLTKANTYADIAIMADIGSRFENVCIFDQETKTTYLYGPKYWVLRPEFFEYQRRGKPKVKKPKRILLIFGGSDPANLTSEALDQLLRLGHSYIIDVVLGAHYPHIADLNRVHKLHDSTWTNVTIYQNISNVAEMMHRADLVLAAPGLSAFEALCVGTPIIVVPHDELQRDTYQGFMCMLERVKLSELGAMIESGEFTYPDNEQIIRMAIGEGIQELKDLIINSKRTDDNEMG